MAAERDDDDVLTCALEIRVAVTVFRQSTTVPKTSKQRALGGEAIISYFEEAILRNFDGCKEGQFHVTSGKVQRDGSLKSRSATSSIPGTVIVFSFI